MALHAWAGAFAFAAGIAAAAGAGAQTYPAKPVRLVVVSAPGGTTDTLARTFSQRLADRVGQSIVIDNKPGAGGVIAVETVARAAADGYTLLLSNMALSLMPALYSRLPFDPRDLVPVALLGETGAVMVTNPGLPPKTVQELIAYSKAQRGGLNFAGGTTGSTAHLAVELLRQMTGANLVHVPYKGTGAAITALIAGEAQVSFLTIPPCVPQIQAGRLRGIATGGLKRSAALPELPTVAESGVAGFDVNAWNGVLAPRGTPRAVIALLNRELNAIAAVADVKSRALAQGTELETLTPEQFGAFLAAQSAKWGKLAKATNMRAD